ncbi:MAG: phage tail protein [Blautia sp.]|nr:phage tail protein [Blautia sp.]
MITVRLEPTSLNELEAGLDLTKKESRAVLKGAINKAATEINKRLQKGIKGRYQLSSKTRGKVKESITLKRAKVADLVATIKVNSRIGDLYSFKVSPNGLYPGGKGAPKFIKGKVAKDNNLKRLILAPGEPRDKHKAFVVQYKSGHIAVAQRVMGSHMKGKPQREAIKNLYAPSITKMGEIIYKDEIDGLVADQILTKAMNEQVEKLLAKKGSV